MKMKLQELRGLKVHLVGVGGAGMSGLARIMISEGILVSGSDMKESSVLSGLRAIGVTIFLGHTAENIDGVQVIVSSSAIGKSNPEMLAAKENGISILTRAQALSILMSESKSIAVAGTHGKTTTTSMLTVALQSAGIDPSFAIGGVLTASGSNAHKGSGNLFVVEADESDGSFVEYHPFGAIITNVEHDHVDFFQTPTAVFAAFQEFANTVSPEGFIVYCLDDSGAATIGKAVTHCKTLSYGTDAMSDLRIDQIELLPNSANARALWHGLSIGKLHLSIPGFHNLLNAAAALTAGLALHIAGEDLISGVNSFRGTGRRFELKGEANGIRVIDDYGHHPTEIHVTLETAKRFATDGRVLVIFQPHRYSRTKAFVDRFALELDRADHAWILEIYSAGEQPISGISGDSIAQAMKHGTFQPNFVSVISEVVEFANPGDVILTLGAGDVNSLAPLILEAVAKKYAE